MTVTVSPPDKESLSGGWYKPMGFTLQVIGNHPAVIIAADESFGRFGPMNPVEHPDFTFHFFEHSVVDDSPGKPVFREHDHLVYQTTGRGSTLVADTQKGLVFGYFSPATLANTAYFRWHFLELAFFRMLEARGLMGVHGAGVVKNNRAILLRAKSGSGKTTLAYAAARRGFRALAEDVVWLDRQRNRWWGMPWSFHLLPDAKELFPELIGYKPVLQTNNEMKLEVNLEELWPDSTLYTAEPGVVLFLERRPVGASRLEQIDRDTAHKLWPAGKAGLEMTSPHHKLYVDELLANNTYRLFFGDDIENAVGLLDTLVA